MRQTTTGARTRGTATQQPITWTDVRTWAAAGGIRSAAALRDWLEGIAQRPRSARPPDPRETLLLRALARYARMIPANGQVPPARHIADVYRPLFRALTAPDVGSYSRYVDNVPADLYEYPPGINGPDWLAPVVDPLAEDGRLWPPTPVTTSARIAEVTQAAFGRPPPDTNALIRSLSSGTSNDPAAFSDAVADTLNSLGPTLQRDLRALGRLQVHPDAPRIASPESIAEARARWPGAADGHFAPPFVVAVFSGPSVRWPSYDGSVGPVHGALIAAGDDVLAVLIVADDTNEEVAFSTLSGKIDASALWSASGGWSQPIADLLAGFIDAVRADQGQSIGFEPLAIPTIRRSWLMISGANENYLGRAFEPAELLAAIAEQARSGAARRIDAALTSGNNNATGARSLADIAARAYRGNLTDVNVPEEVRTRAAAQAAVRACSPGASDADRARIVQAASVLGVQGPLLEGNDLTALCDASASATEWLYRGATGETFS